MSELEWMLASKLPRPRTDAAFRRDLLGAVLAGSEDAWAEPLKDWSRRRRYSVAGAVVGAAALVGAALGWRLRRPPGTGRAA
jgi:hypothetical protein